MVLRWPPQPGPLGAGVLPDVLANLWTIPPSPPNAPPLRQAGTILPPMPPGMGVYGKSYAPCADASNSSVNASNGTGLCRTDLHNVWPPSPPPHGPPPSPVPSPPPPPSPPGAPAGLLGIFSPSPPPPDLGSELMRGIRASGNWDTDPNAKKDAAGIPPAPPRAPPASPPPCEDRALGAKSPYSVDYCDGKPCTCAFVIPNFVVPACTTAVAACVAAVCAAAIKDWPIYDEYYPAPTTPGTTIGDTCQNACAAYGAGPCASTAADTGGMRTNLAAEHATANQSALPEPPWARSDARRPRSRAWLAATS